MSSLIFNISIFSSEEVKEYLKEYIVRSEALVGGDQNLYLLCIQCFEVSSIFHFYSGCGSQRRSIALSLVRLGSVSTTETVVFTEHAIALVISLL